MIAESNQSINALYEWSILIIILLALANRLFLVIYFLFIYRFFFFFFSFIQTFSWQRQIKNKKYPIWCSLSEVLRVHNFRRFILIYFRLLYMSTTCTILKIIILNRVQVDYISNFQNKQTYLICANTISKQKCNVIL